MHGSGESADQIGQLRDLRVGPAREDLRHHGVACAVDLSGCHFHDIDGALSDHLSTVAAAMVDCTG